MSARHVKKGDTIKIVSHFTSKTSGLPISLTGYDFNSLIKSKNNEYQIITDDDQAVNGILVHSIDTSLMELGTYNWDIRLTKNLESFSTTTVQIVVAERIS